MSEEIDWKQRALDAAATIAAKDANMAMKEEWLLEWKRVAEELKAQIPAANRLCSELEKWKQRSEAAEKACAEMREAFKSFECTICDENHKFRPECNACLSGEPSACTCCNEELVDCPCCMEGEYAEGYRKLRAAIKDGACLGYLSPAEVKEKVGPMVEFLKHTNDSWDCDIGGNGNHHYMCRCCEAEKLLDHARKEGLV